MSDNKVPAEELSKPWRDIADVGEFFRSCRMCPQFHLGLGDIRLSYADQMQITNIFQHLTRERDQYKFAAEMNKQTIENMMGGSR